MPNRNIHGGKAYKKGKKTGDDDEDGGPFYERQAGQDYARVLRMIGDRRVVCFCNDGGTRVCKIRGGICRGPNKQRIEIGDIVLISLREFEEADTHIGASDTVPDIITYASGRKEIADILHKYHRKHWRKIRKEPDIHDLLLVENNATPDELGDIFEDPVDKKDEPLSDTESEVNIDDI